MRAVRVHASLVALLFLTACGTLLPPKPTNPTEQLATIAVLNTGIANRVSEQLDNDEITTEQGAERIALLETVEAGTTVGAAALQAGRPQDAQALLKVVESALLQLQKYVNQGSQ